jgi:hypothetical protein
MVCDQVTSIRAAFDDNIKSAARLDPGRSAAVSGVR